MSPVRWWDLPAAGILFVAMLTSVGRLGITSWTQHLDYVGFLAVLGLLLGLALGKSLFQRRVVIALACIYSLVLLPWQLSRAMGYQTTLLARVVGLVGRLSFSLGELIQNQPVEDTLLFVAFLSLVYWIIGLCAGYWLTRHANFLVCILPAGLVMLIVQIFDSYYAGRIWFLAFYLFLSLMLLGRLYYLRNYIKWREKGVFLVSSTGLDLSNGVLVTAAFIILFAWTLPATFPYIPRVAGIWERISETWQDTLDHLSNAIAGVEGSGRLSGDYYGDRLALGNGSSQSDRLLFTAHLPPEAQLLLPRYYWRGRVYDRYEYGQWYTSETVEQDLDPEAGGLPIPNAQIGKEATIVFVNHILASRTFYTPPQPAWINLPATSFSFNTSAGGEDLVLLRPKGGLEPGQRYRVRSRLINPSIEELRQAGVNYPEWVTQRYLQLPEGLSPRVQELALQIAEGLETPYDKAAAVTGYLRTNIEYSELIASPPLKRDILEWFLFDEKKGFCNYYATSEVILLRLVGVPARMVVGFAQGEYDEEYPDFGRAYATYSIRQYDAHAWPEVYFPGIGWVEFEPTANQSEIERPLTHQKKETDIPPVTPLLVVEREKPIRPEEESPSAMPGSPDHWQATIRMVSLSITAILLILLLLLNRRYAWAGQLPLLLEASLERKDMQVPGWLEHWARYSELSPIARAFNVINFSLRWLGEDPPYHATPAQRAAMLTALLPEAATAIEILTAEHQATLYSPRPGNLDRARRAHLAIWRSTLKTKARRLVESVRRRF